MTATKLKSLNEWGMRAAWRVARRQGARKAGRMIGKTLIKNAPKIAKTTGIELSKGVAVETGFEISKHGHDQRHIEDERRRLNRERIALIRDQRKALAAKNKELESHQVKEAVIHQEPPVVLVLKRKFIRLYPQGEKIAIYRNDKLGVNFAVPYDEKELGGTLDTGPTIGAVSEGIGQMIGKLLSKVRKPKVFAKPLTADEVEELIRPRSVTTDTSSQARTALGALAGAVGAGYLANKGFQKARKKVENPNPNKKVHGQPVYETSHNYQHHANHVNPRPTVTYYKASARQYAKLGAVGGIAFAAGKTAFDVAKDLYKSTKKQKRRHVKEGLLSMNEHSEVLNEVVLPLVAAGALEAGTAAAGAEAAGTGILSAIGRHMAISSAAEAGINGIKKIAGVKKPPIKSMSQYKAPSDLAPVKKTIQPQKQQTDGDVVDEMTRTQHPEGGRHPHQQAMQKLHVPKGTGREMVKAGAVALATVGVQKVFDLAYDKYRDSKELERKEKEARAEARARAKAAPKKVIVKKIQKPHQTITIKKETVKEASRAATAGMVFGGTIAAGTAAALATKKFSKKHSGEKSKLPKWMVKESAFQDLQDIVTSSQHKHVKHDNGTRTAVDAYTAQAILNVHKHLKPENKVKLEQMVNRDRAGLLKIADFAFRQHNS